MESLLALRRENKEVLWSSMVKDTMKRKKPSFNESYHGYRSFSDLLEDAKKEGLAGTGHRQASRTYVVTRLRRRAERRGGRGGGNGAGRKRSRRRRSGAKRRDAAEAAAAGRSRAPRRSRRRISVEPPRRRRRRPDEGLFFFPRPLGRPDRS